MTQRNRKGLHHGRWTQAHAVLRDMLARGLIEQKEDGSYSITRTGRLFIQHSQKEAA